MTSSTGGDGPGLREVAAALSGAGLVLAARPLVGQAPSDWRATNFRGEPVSLLAGPVLAGAAVVAAPTSAAAVAAVGALVAGRYDDVAGARPEQQGDKGFRGHLAALRAGRVSGGAVKVVLISGAAVLAATSQQRSDDRRDVVDVPLDALLVAGTANLVNLLDLRPGRALKVVLLAALAAMATSSGDRRAFAALVGASAAALPADLAEQAMLGDAGANAAGALLGLACTRGFSRELRAVLLTLVAILTAASERVSFSAVIDRTAVLRQLDSLGRKPVAEFGGTPSVQQGRRTTVAR